MRDAGFRLRVHAVVDSGWTGRAGGVLPGGGDGSSRSAGAVRLREREIGYRLVEGEETAAAVTEEDAADGDGSLLLHARVVEELLGSRSVVPVPRPLRARDEDAVRALLDRARLPLREALDRFEGCYEVRLHVRRRPEGGSSPEGEEGEAERGASTGGEAAQIGRLFRGLRSRARSARRLPPREGHVFTAAFLVPRDEWIAFVEESSTAGRRLPVFEVDVTGPWAPYDFVRFRLEGPGREGGGRP